jgi:hypothetical protein
MYILKANCIPVKGYKRSILYNLQNNTYDYIPNSLCELFENCRTTNEWYTYIIDNEKEIIDEYIEFLLANDYLLDTKKLDINCFTSISFAWEECKEVSILNLNYEEEISKYLHNLNVFLVKSRTKNISLQYIGGLKTLNNLLGTVKDTYVTNIVLYLQYKQFKGCLFEKLISSNPLISKIVLLGADRFSIKYIDTGKQIPIQKIESILINSEIKPMGFVINKMYFIEAHLYNTFFHKRLFVSKKGIISLTPLSDRIADISKDPAKEIINRKSIQKYWLIKKDSIETCKECEHRYMCYDSRIPTQENNKWYYMSDCGYNPYINKWVDEDGYWPVNNTSPCIKYQNLQLNQPENRSPFRQII